MHAKTDKTCLENIRLKRRKSDKWVQPSGPAFPTSTDPVIIWPFIQRFFSFFDWTSYFTAPKLGHSGVLAWMAALNTAWELSEAELKEKTVAELRDICELQNIRGVSRLRKQELVDRIIAEMSSNSNNNNNKSHSAKKSNANSNDASGRGTGAAAAAGERKEGGSGAGASDDKVCSLEHGKRFKGASMLTADEFETKVKELIRDTNISKYHKDCAAIFGAGDYYRTRSRTQAAKAAAIAAATASSSSFSSSSSSASSLEMEHTFECQLAGHAVMQTTSLHNILRNLDVTSPRTQQPAAVKRVLDAVFAVQNERQEFFNIKLLDKTLNVQVWYE